MTLICIMEYISISPSSTCSTLHSNIYYIIYISDGVPCILLTLIRTMQCLDTCIRKSVCLRHILEFYNYIILIAVTQKGPLNAPAFELGKIQK